MRLELVKETHVFGENRIKIELNFRDEYAQLMEYLEINQEVFENA